MLNSGYKGSRWNKFYPPETYPEPSPVLEVWSLNRIQANSGQQMPNMFMDLEIVERRPGAWLWAGPSAGSSWPALRRRTSSTHPAGARVDRDSLWTLGRQGRCRGCFCLSPELWGIPVSCHGHQVCKSQAQLGKPAGLEGLSRDWWARQHPTCG